MPSSELRIIDACINRASEGLRVLEDISRLLLNDVFLTRRLKDMRHDLIRGKLPFNQLLQARDSAGDVGMDIEAEGQEKQKDLPSIVIANSRRVQESLRTLEEMSKLPDSPPGLDSVKFRHARFTMYAIEKELIFKLLRKDKIERLKGVHLILDTGIPQETGHIEVARKAINGGVRAIHLHDKTSKKDLFVIAEKLRRLCASNSVLFIVHSHLDIAMSVEADGLHLEPDDLPLAVARKLLPVDKIIGCAVSSIDQAVTVHSEGADYISTGLNILQPIRKSTALPLVAVGGITKNNVAEILNAGASAVAVLNAELSGNVETAIRQIVKRIEGKK